MPPLKSISELVVLDLGVGMAAAIIAAQLRGAGAEVIRIEPDGGDPFYDIYPAYAVWRDGGRRAGVGDRDAVARRADICILGGEDYPGLARPSGGEHLAALNPRLVVLEVRGDIGERPAPAVDLLVQAHSGHCYEQFGDRPAASAFPAPTYGAVLLGLISIFAALLQRERTGRGLVTATSLRQGASLWWAADWSSAEHPDQRFDAVIPKGVRQLIFRCRDGKYLQLVLGIPGAVVKAFEVLGIDAPADPADRSLPDARNGAQNYFFRDSDLLARHAAGIDRQTLLEGFWRVGLAAEGVLEPGENWDDEQTRVNGLIETDAAGGRHVGSPIRMQAADADPVTAAGAAATPRIVDLGSFLGGPFASRIPAAMGADVIKVEALTGDPNRHILRSFASGNRGKRSIAVDAKHPEGLAILRRLCATANAVHHNFRPGVAERLGLDPASLHGMRPQMTTLESPGYGTRGPKAQNSGFDMIMQACCGLEMQGAGAGNPPLWYRSPLVDYAGGAMGTIALLMGLLEQARFGVGVDAETSLLSTGLFLISELIQTPEGEWRGLTPLNRELTGAHPAEALYEAADGWLAIAARSQRMAADLAACLGLELGPRADWDARSGAAIAAAIRPLPRAATLLRLQDIGVWAVACVEDGWAAARADPALSACGLVGELQEGAYGAVSFVDRLVDPRLKIGDRPGSTAAPALGEHTTEILGELGFSAAEIADLYARKVVA